MEVARQDKLCVVGSGGGCSTPAAPTLSASPSTINSGSSSTLSASGCTGGTITWSDGLGTGTSKSVSPTATKTYTATCTVTGGCVSAPASVTVTVNAGGDHSVSVKNLNCLLVRVQLLPIRMHRMAAHVVIRAIIIIM